MAHAISRSLAAMIATEQHLWLDLSGLKEKDRAFLMVAPISPLGLFGTVIETVHYIPTVVRTLQSPLLTLPQTESVGDRVRKRVSLPGPNLRGGLRWQSCEKPKEDFRDVITARQQSKSNP